MGVSKSLTLRFAYDLKTVLKEVRERSDTPLAVGFGI
jgi:tryptophan synthase alpha subunit